MSVALCTVHVILQVFCTLPYTMNGKKEQFYFFVASTDVSNERMVNLHI